MGIGVAPPFDVGRRRAPDTDFGEAFRERGYVAPVPIFSQRECRKILSRLGQAESRPPLDWGKARAVTSVDFYALATNDRILDVVTALIGEDVLLWGASLSVKWPGRIRPWHTDIESAMPAGGTVSVWIGLTHTNERSALRVVPFSHRFGTTLQQVTKEKGGDRQTVSDADVSSWARELDPRSGVEPLDMTKGEALVFDGRLWHGSDKMQLYGRRCAVLLQYATPDTAIRIPNPDRLEWPFESYEFPRPPCIVVRGHNSNGVNRVVPGPAATDNPLLPGLSTRIHPLQLPMEPDGKSHTLFRGATPTVSAMRCHVSVLEPGPQAHPAQRHEEEELLLMMAGEAELEVEDGEGTVVHHVKRGSLAYHPAGVAHRIRSMPGAHVTCLTFNWAADDEEQRGVLPFRLVSPPDAPARLLSGETRYLRHLSADLTTLQPGAGDTSHVGAHDIGIVVLEGTVEILGQRVGPCGVGFHAAGEPHGIRNVGDEPATYVVFEFHGRRSKGYGVEAPASHSLLRLGRDRQKVKRAAANAARSVGRSIRDRLRIGSGRG